MTPSSEADRLTKAARLMILLELQERGELEGLSLQAIANLFPAPPNRSTILRDKRLLPKLMEIRDEMRKYANSKAETRKNANQPASNARKGKRESGD